MCYAIIRVTWQDNTKTDIQVEKHDDLPAKIESVQSKVEAVSYRVYATVEKGTKRSVWEKTDD